MPFGGKLCGFQQVKILWKKRKEKTSLEIFLFSTGAQPPKNGHRGGFPREIHTFSTPVQIVWKISASFLCRRAVCHHLPMISSFRLSTSAANSGSRISFSLMMLYEEMVVE